MLNHHLSSVTTCSITSLNTNSTVQTLAANVTQTQPPRRKKLVAQSRVSKQRINKELVAAGGSQSQVSLQLQLQLQKSTANFHQSPPAGSAQPPPPKPASSPLPKSPIAGSTAINRPEVKSIWKNSNSGSDTSSQVPASPQHNHAKRPVTASDVVVQAQSPVPAGLQQIPVPSSAQKQQPVSAPTKKLAQQPCSKQQKQQNVDKQQQQTSPTPDNNNQLQQVNNNNECQHHANNGGVYVDSVGSFHKKLDDSEFCNFKILI